MIKITLTCLLLKRLLMKVYTLSTYKGIKELCQQLRFKNEHTNCITLCRGTKTDFLCSSILTNNDHNAEKLNQIEEAIHQEFVHKYAGKISEQNGVLRDWKLRIMGREYGLKNRLMDWSFVFYNSLDFATFIYPGTILKQTHVYLWILSIELDYKKDLQSIKETPFNAIKDSFVFNGIQNYPQYHARRQFVQGGFFLVQPNALITSRLDEQPFFKERLIKIQIPVGDIEIIRQELAKTEQIDLSRNLMIEMGTKIDLFCELLNNKYLGSQYAYIKSGIKYYWKRATTMI